KIAALGGVEARSAAESDDEIRARRPGHRDTAIHVLRRGILPDFIIDRHRETGTLDRLDRARHRARFRDAGISHEKNPIPPESRRFRADDLDFPRPENHASRRGVFESDHPLRVLKTVAERLNRKGVGRHRVTVTSHAISAIWNERRVYR